LYHGVGLDVKAERFRMTGRSAHPTAKQIRALRTHLNPTSLGLWPQRRSYGRPGEASDFLAFRSDTRKSTE
jgi:hypothetical protein